MLITFDLDDTLILPLGEQPVEQRRGSWLSRFVASCSGRHEQLRAGTVELFSWLRQNDWKIGVYTTSDRGHRRIRRCFAAYDIELDSITNRQDHERLIQQITTRRTPSKLPSAVGSCLHVDDSDGVRIEGERLGFRVLVVAPSDSCWAERVLAEALSVARELQSSEASVPNGEETRTDEF
jgi:hypothetical protein